MAWTKFELSRLNYNVAGGLIFLSLLQGAAFYYLIYLYLVYGSTLFFAFALSCLILVKLTWLIGLEYQIIKYTPVGPHHYWSILLIDLLPLVLYRYRHSWSMTFKRYFYASISHSFLVGIPMAIMATVYVVNYGDEAPLHAPLVSIVLVAVCLPLIFVGHGGVIPSKANAFHLICLLLDVFKGFLTIYFIANFIYYNKYDGDGTARWLWTLPIVYYVSYLFAIKSVIISPIYALFLFIFYAFYSPPHCTNCECHTWNLLLLATLPIILIFVWLFVDTIFFSYPLLIFYHNAYEYQFEIWFNVIDFLHKATNKYDYQLRLWLFNYLWLIQKIYIEEEDPNPVYTPAEHKQQEQNAFVHVIHEEDDDDIFQCESKEPMLSVINSEEQNEHKLNMQQIAPENERFLVLLHQVERTLIWYLTPKTDDEEKWENKKFIGFTEKQKQKQMDLEWNERFDLSVFIPKDTKISSYLYQKYDELMADVLMKFFDVKSMVGTSPYDKVTQAITDTKGYKCFKLFRKVMEGMLLYFLGPIQLLFAIYGVIVYNVIMSTVLAISLLVKNSVSRHEKGLFWFINCYYVTIVIMLLLAPSFREMMKAFWYSLYSRDGSWKEQPDKYLDEVHNYIHLHRERIDVIQQRFNDINKTIATYIFEYCGFIPIQCDGKRDYIMTNAMEMLDIMQSNDDERGQYMKLIEPSANLLNDMQLIPNKMILKIQKRKHAAKFNRGLSTNHDSTNNT